MEFTLDQALQKGIEAHKAGNAEEVDRFYTAIIKLTKHPDANHNMGVLAVGIGKVEEALPFFKTALDANPTVAQYWLSHIEALLKLNKVDKARAIFEEARSRGAADDKFDEIEAQLSLLKQQNKIDQKSSKHQNKTAKDESMLYQKRLSLKQQKATIYP